MPFISSGKFGAILERPPNSPVVILKTIAGQFERDRKYSEKELNGILKDINEDFATIRRYLIESGFLDRTDDGKEYWLK